MVRTVIIDIETDSLNPTVIWVIVCKDVETGDVKVFERPDRSPEQFCSYASTVDCWVGHNSLCFDIPVVNRLVGRSTSWFIDYRNCVDTLVVSRLLNFSLDNGHSLEAWGERLGCHKTSFTDWSKLSPEMIEYCIQDVEVTYRLWLHFKPWLVSERWTKAIRVEHDIAIVSQNMHENGFYFDIDLAREIEHDVNTEIEALEKELQNAFPPKLRPIREISPRQTKSGSLSKQDFRWAGDDLRAYSPGASFTLCEWVAFNPASPKDIVTRLNEAGWKPTARTKGHDAFLKERGKKDPEKKKRYEEFGWKVNEENLETLPADAPEAARTLVKWLLLNARRKTLNEWFSAFSDSTHRIHGSFNHIGTWTQRMSHDHPNMGNTPSVDSKYNGADLKDAARRLGTRLRSCWTVPRDRLLVGVDADAIQLRVLAHYMDDPEFTEALINGDKDKGTDAHTLNALKLGFDQSYRPRAKTYIYAWLLGAGGAKQASILGIALNEAREREAKFIDGYPGLSRLKRDIIPEDAQRGYFTGFDGRFVIIDGDTIGRKEYKALGGYLQNGEAVIMKHARIRWGTQLRKEGIPFWPVNFVHDEWQTETINDEEVANYIAQVQMDAIRDTGIDLGLRCPMAGSKKIGLTWMDTH